VPFWFPVYSFSNCGSSVAVVHRVLDTVTKYVLIRNAVVRNSNLNKKTMTKTREEVDRILNELIDAGGLFYVGFYVSIKVFKENPKLLDVLPFDYFCKEDREKAMIEEPDYLFIFIFYEDRDIARTLLPYSEQEYCISNEFVFYFPDLGKLEYDPRRNRAKDLPYGIDLTKKTISETDQNDVFIVYLNYLHRGYKTFELRNWHNLYVTSRPKPAAASR
jgi:hypothetical protein